MKKIILFTQCLTSLLTLFTLYCQETPSNTTPAQAQERINQTSSAVKTLSDLLFNPVIPSEPPKPNPYPLVSSNAAALDATFGANGLALDATILQHLKNFYFYLEYIVKLELAGKIAAFSLQNNSDVYSILETTGWKGLIDQATAKAGSWKQLVSALASIEEPRFDLIQGSINASTWQEVITTPFWHSITITPNLITQSLFWQKYLKYSVTRIFEHESSLLEAIYDVEKRIFPYIPNIEVAYYNADFVNLRNSSEYFRLNLALSDKIHDRLIRQIRDWQNVIDPKTNQIDLVATYSAALSFKQTPFYSLLAIADQNLETLAQQAIARDLPITNIQYAQEPMAQSEITCIAMLKNIQGQLLYLFDKQHLGKTFEILSNKSIVKPEPSVLLHEPDDYLYLEDLALVLDRFKNTETKPQVQSLALDKGNEQVVVQSDVSSWVGDKWDTIKDEGKNLWSTVKETGQDIAGSGFDAWQGIKDEAKAIGYGGAALGVLLAGDPADAQKLLQNAASLQIKVAADLKQTLTDAGKLLDDTVKVADAATSIYASSMSIALAELTRNTTLAELYEKEMKASLGLLINLYAVMEAGILEFSGGLLYLTVDALAIAANVTTKSVMDIVRGNFKDLGQDLLDGIETMVVDIATTLWSTVTFVGKYILQALTDAVALIGYISAMITENLVSIYTSVLNGFAMIAGSVGFERAQDFLNTASAEVAAHKQVISATVTTALLIGAVVLTDGAALPLLAMTVGPQVFQIAGGFQQDERTKQMLADQTEFLHNYQTFVANNKIISQNVMNASNEELSLKNKAQITNEERELGFYQNFLSQYFESTKEQMSFYLGNYLAPQLTQDENYNLRFADVGTLYGFKTGDGDKTGVLNLNPSQGFPLYNKGRDLFSQEIAVLAPLGAQGDGTATPKFWFNQKETMPLLQEITDIEVRWQAIYTLNTFYLGLYFGGEEINIQAIKDTKKANIDAAHLAKMLVYKKENKESPITLGLYEHEGKGWFAGPINGPSFEVGTWYRMKMQLNNTTLMTKIWKEKEEEPPSWQSFTVAKTSQKTLGMISSGASIQYQIIAPKIPVTAVSSYRTPLPVDWATEYQRGISSQIITYQQLFPSIGSSVLGSTDLSPLALQAVGKPEIIKGQFIYTTKATQLTNKQNQVIDDYVILGTQGVAIDDLGASPRPPLRNNTNAAAVSLISGKAFDKDAVNISICTDVLGSFLKTHGPLSDDLTNKLQNLKRNYLSNLIGPFVFGPISLLATGTEDMAQGQFIYQATSPEMELRDQQGNPIKDAMGNLVYDYFVVVAGTGPIVGAQYDATTQQIQSLVTGYRYDRTGKKLTDAKHSVGSIALEDYQSILGTLRPELSSVIKNNANFYATIINEKITAKIPLEIKPAQRTSSENMSTSTGAQHETITTGTPSQEVKPAVNSLQNLTEDAGGGEMG
jgi:hypothetical protein